MNWKLGTAVIIIWLPLRHRFAVFNDVWWATFPLKYCKCGIAGPFCLYCGVPAPFCSFVLLLRGWPGDLHAGSCYGPGPGNLPSARKAAQYGAIILIRFWTWSYTVPHLNLDPNMTQRCNMECWTWNLVLEHQCMPPRYSSNNQVKAVADIQRYRYKYMWHAYVYIYIYIIRFRWNIVNNSIAILGIQRVSWVQGRWLSELFHSCFCWIFHLSQGLCHTTSIFQRIGHHYILPQRNSQRREDKG